MKFNENFSYFKNKIMANHQIHVKQKSSPTVRARATRDLWRLRERTFTRCTRVVASKIPLIRFDRRWHNNLFPDWRQDPLFVMSAAELGGI